MKRWVFFRRTDTDTDTDTDGNDDYSLQNLFLARDTNEECGVPPRWDMCSEVALVK